MSRKPYTGRSPLGIGKRTHRILRLLGISAISLMAVLAGGWLAWSGVSLDNAQAEVSSVPMTALEPSQPVEEVQNDAPAAPGRDEAPAEEIPTPYDYSQPVPLSEEVDRSYFDDAVFIGDSRTDGLLINTGLSNATFYTYKGLMVTTVFTEPVIKVDDKKVTVMEALEKTEFSKAYVMLGINEAGWESSKAFVDKYAEIVDAVLAINPDAVVYVQSILPVSREVSETHAYITNEKLTEFNDLLRQMAQEKEVYFVDTAASVADEEGVLPDDAAVDGIHPGKAYCRKWLAYLQTHTVEKAD